MIAKGAVSNPTWVDPDEAPEWTDEMFEQADLYDGNRLVRAGKSSLTTIPGHQLVPLPDAIVKRFRETGPGWQSRMDEALTEWLTTHPPAGRAPDS